MAAATQLKSGLIHMLTLNFRRRKVQVMVVMRSVIFVPMDCAAATLSFMESSVAPSGKI